jgi:protein-S-isoprenylcysteine O-methyltransferase Ste14
MSPSELVGMLIQGAAALPITLTLTNSPLRPMTAELIATIVLASLAVSLLCWTLWSLRGASASETLVTKGSYSWMRHPMYSAFLAMLLATGLVVSARLTLTAAVVLYVAGTELRITSEEGALEKQFPTQYEQYRLRTRWRYVPGLR